MLNHSVGFRLGSVQAAYAPQCVQPRCMPYVHARCVSAPFDHCVLTDDENEKRSQSICVFANHGTSREPRTRVWVAEDEPRLYRAALPKMGRFPYLGLFLIVV